MAVEQKRRQEITNRLRLGKAPAITLGAAAMRYVETVLKARRGPDKLKRDLGWRSPNL
jgi:hypothetical protein